MLDIYGEMKTKMKKGYDYNTHWYNLYNALVSMFKYEGLPETLRPEFIEMNLIHTGSCGVCEIDGNLYTGVGGYCGNVVNFIPTEYQITNIGVGHKQGEIGKDFAVGWNNAATIPDLCIEQYANILTEIDVSERCNVIYSRFLRIPKVHDNKQKKAIEDSIADIKNGKITAVVSDNLRDIIKGVDGESDFLDLTDVDKVDKLQYLNQYRDNVVKRFFMMYGQGMQSTAKLAQQTTDELHGYDKVSMILPEQRLYYRKKFVEDINNLFGTNISVDYSDAWKAAEKEMSEEKEGEDNVEESETTDDSESADDGAT